MRERTRQIIDELQCERRHREIERAVAKRQRFQIRGDGERRPLCAQLRLRIDRDHRTHDAFQRVAHRVARRAEIGGKLELSQHHGKPLRKLRRHTIEQKRRRPERNRPRAARAQQIAIEQDGALCH